MEDVKNVSLAPLNLASSAYIKPMLMRYRQAGKDKVWEMILSHRSVCVVVHNIDRDVLVLVRQFRPTVFLANLRHKLGTGEALSAGLEDLGSHVDPEDVRKGITLELCAGIVDKDLSLAEIARLEVLEECGYDVPLDRFRQVQSFFASVGTSGDRMTMFHVEVTDAMKVEGGGGGLEEEGELIEVVEMTLAEARAHVFGSPQVSSPPFTLYGLAWFLAQKAVATDHVPT